MKILYKILIGVLIFYTIIHILIVSSVIIVVFGDFIRILIPLIIVCIANLSFTKIVDKKALDKNIFKEYKKNNELFKEKVSVCLIISFCLKTAIFLVFMNLVKFLINYPYVNDKFNIFFKIINSNLVNMLIGILIGIYLTFIHYKYFIDKLNTNFKWLEF